MGGQKIEGKDVHGRGGESLGKSKTKGFQE
jgi:hypothetical protein